MKSYEYLPHTADVKFRAYGETLEQAFCNASYAFTDIMTKHTKVKEIVKKNCEISAENLEALLYDFLEQFIFLLETEGFLLHKITSLTIQDTSLTVECTGDLHPEQYDIKAHIKAVTYQQMSIQKTNNQWCLQVIVDV